MTPEDLVDEIYEKFGEYFEVIPEQGHERFMVGVLAKMVIDQRFLIEHLQKRVEANERN